MTASKRDSARRTKIVLATFGLLILLASSASANHPWICSGTTAFHWSTPNLTYRAAAEELVGFGPVPVRNPGDYLWAFSRAISVWQPTIINLNFSSSGRIRLFYEVYGFNGWLGLATISPSGCVIQNAWARLNDTYLRDTTTYNQTAVDHVACQEVGHDFGLDHNRSSFTTCMNDFVLFAGDQINAHDHDQLDDIYGPPDNLPPTASFTWSNPFSTRVDFNASSSFDPDGSIVSYQWDFGDGSTATTTSATITHWYGSQQTFVVRLTVVDNGGASGTDLDLISLCGTQFICELDPEPETDAGRSQAEPSEAGAQIGHASWVFHAESLDELVAEADLIVVAEHVFEQPGRQIGRGENALPFTFHGFFVHEAWKGEVKDQSVIVEQTGGRLANGSWLSIDDGGAFEKGRKYLLFLKSQGNGGYYQINQQARYGLDDGRLVGVDPDDSVVARLHGRLLSTARTQIRVGDAVR